MIDSIMLMLIGVLSGGLAGVAVVPLVHNRAVRLTTRRLRATLPESMRQIQAQRDLLRAEFAISMRRLEITVAGLNNKMVRQLIELSRKSETLNRLKGERDALQGELVVLKARVETLEAAVPLPASRLPANPLPASRLPASPLPPSPLPASPLPARTGKEVVKQMRLSRPLSLH